MDMKGFPSSPSDKEPTCQRRRCKRRRFDPWVVKTCWRRKWQPTLSILAWRIPWTEEPGGLQSMGPQRVRHNWATEHEDSKFISNETALAEALHPSLLWTISYNWVKFMMLRKSKCFQVPTSSREVRRWIVFTLHGLLTSISQNRRKLYSWKILGEVITNSYMLNNDYFILCEYISPTWCVCLI